MNTKTTVIPHLFSVIPHLMRDPECSGFLVKPGMTQGNSGMTMEFYLQKIRLSADFLTEYNTNVLHPDLSIGTLSQNTDNVKFVDLTGIEPANPEFSGPGVHQYQAHKPSIAGVWNLGKINSGNLETWKIWWWSKLKWQYRK